MNVEIRPIPTTRWHGKTGKDSFARPKTIQALVNPEKMEYRVELSKEEKKRLEANLKMDFSTNFTGSAHPVWESKMATLVLDSVKPIFLNPNVDYDLIKIRVAKGSKFVANSMAEYENGDFPEATHVIYDELEEITGKASKLEIRYKAIAGIAELSKERKLQLCFILAGKNLRGKTDGHITVLLNQLCEKDPDTILVWLAKDKEYTAIYSLVVEALSKNVLVKEGHKILYMSDVIADSIEGAVDYFIDLKNNGLKLRIMEQVAK